MTEFDRRLTNLAGKDYFTTEEAAYYCCVSRSQFLEMKSVYNLSAFVFIGKKMYRKVDLQRALEEAAKRSRPHASSPEAAGRSAPNLRPTKRPNHK